MAPRGAISILRCALVPMMAVTTLDHDDAVAMAPAAMPAVIAMHAVFGAGTIHAVMMTSALDHHRLRAGERRQCNRERADSGKHITNLLHDVLLQWNANLNGAFAGTFRRNRRRILNACSGGLIAALLCRRWRAGGDVFAVPDRVLAALAAIVDCAQAALLREEQAELAGLLQQGEVHHHIEQAVGADHRRYHFVFVLGLAEIAPVHHPSVLPDLVSQERALLAVGPDRAVDRPSAEQTPLLNGRRERLGTSRRLERNPQHCCRDPAVQTTPHVLKSPTSEEFRSVASCAQSSTLTAIRARI